MDLTDRIRNEKCRAKIVDAETAASWIHHRMVVGTSGFTPVGYPKMVPEALAARVADGRERLRIDLIAGASVGRHLDGALARVKAIRRRLPYQHDSELRRQINAGEVDFCELHLSHLPAEIRYGNFGGVDVAIVEAVAITEDGHIVPSTSVGISPSLVRCARKVIVEVNTTHPIELEGIHDIWTPPDQPDRIPVPIVKASNRIGRPYIIAGPDRIDGIVISDVPDDDISYPPCTEAELRIAQLLLEFVEHETRVGRLPRGLPWQSGVGGVANAVLQGFLKARWEHLEFYSEVLQDSVLDLIDADKLVFASGCSLSLSRDGFERLHKDITRYKRHILLRPQEMSNNPEVIRRLGVLAVNTAVEVDIYGHVNSTHVNGGHVLNGIGGSGDFERNSFMSAFVTPSTRMGGKCSCIVPFASHVDHSEHDVKVVVTEQGLADLRGRSPREVAKAIIEKCSHPDYRDELREYFDRACRETSGHEPHLLKEAFAMHVRLQEKGDMRMRG
jgi:succinyl-CoA:acetate CoA-transferase